MNKLFQGPRQPLNFLIKILNHFFLKKISRFVSTAIKKIVLIKKQQQVFEKLKNAKQNSKLVSLHFKFGPLAVSLVHQGSPTRVLSTFYRLIERH